MSLIGPLSLTRVAGVLRLGVLLLLILAVPAATGLLQTLEQTFSAVMARVPLSGAYVLAVALVGALLPLAARIAAARLSVVRTVLDPYLALLAAQLLSEVVVVLSGGKGLGVVVGLVFSLLRLLQLRQLWPMTTTNAWLRRLLLLQVVVWGLNVVQIGVNRILPLLHAPGPLLP